jgi:hypothetical protein
VPFPKVFIDDYFIKILTYVIEIMKPLYQPAQHCFAQVEAIGMLHNTQI